jgi:hypothetical protein
MSADSFYQFPTIKKFVERSGDKEIKTIVDVGVNVGDVTLRLHHHFPEARIIGYEPVPEYFATALKKTEDIEQVVLHNKAVTAEHRYFDDLGEDPRPREMDLAIVKALPESGVGWQGGSLIGPADHPLLVSGIPVPGYQLLRQPAVPITLAEILEQNSIDEVDLLKMDCEGCESSVLGGSDVDTLRRVRFMTGEYHNLTRFYRVVQTRLLLTHKVCLTGNLTLGSFVAERRRGDRDGLLRHRTRRSVVGQGSDDFFEWNPFSDKPSWLARLRGVRMGID